MTGETLSQEPEYHYERARDRALHRLMQEAWAEQTAGQPDSPMGLFGYMSNSKTELAALLDVLATDGERETVEAAELIGHFLIVEHPDRTVGVRSYPHRDLMLRAFRGREHWYASWRAAQ